MEEPSGPGVPFEEFVVREPAVTRVPQMEGYGDFQQPAYIPRAERAIASAMGYPASYPVDPAESPSRDMGKPEADQNDQVRSERVAAIKRELPDWRLQRDSQEVYQFRDANIPRMRRH